MVQDSHEYIMATIGGVIIAISASLHLYLKGRITGISGIFFGVVTLSDYFWKFTFLLGMIFISTFFSAFIQSIKDTPEDFTNNLSIAGFILSGFFVGFGTKWANGCTSGHGVCGVPRLSIRSIVACVIFCSSGIFASSFRNKFPFLTASELTDITVKLNTKEFHMVSFGLTASIIIIMFCYILIKRLFQYFYDFFISLICGIIFGMGLIISGMNRRTKVINFLNIFSNNWDPSLLFVLCSAVSVNFLLFHWIINVKKVPLFADKIMLPEKTKLDVGIVLGSFIFGCGWGISGLCPGPAIINTFNYIPHVLIFNISLTLGQYSAFKTLH